MFGSHSAILNKSGEKTNLEFYEQRSLLVTNIMKLGEKFTEPG